MKTVSTHGTSLQPTSRPPSHSRDEEFTTKATVPAPHFLARYTAICTPEANLLLQVSHLPRGQGLLSSCPNPDGVMPNRAVLEGGTKQVCISSVQGNGRLSVSGTATGNNLCAHL